ncbi:hypothetical protein PSEUDO9AG_41281 [Pseudomonas sp. 9Ag]|nr:hypothetical protein PSEUDO9AG_41281 [Pseudomonas sp. 9Ag]
MLLITLSPRAGKLCITNSFMHNGREPQRNEAVYGYCEQHGVVFLLRKDAKQRLSGTCPVARSDLASQRSGGISLRACSSDTRNSRD